MTASASAPAGLDLSGRVVLLTGASKGIGAATAAALGRAGASLVAHYGADRAGVEEATAEIPVARKLVVSADLADPAAVDRLWAEALAWQGHVDVLVSNAAVMPLDGGIDDPDEVWDASWHASFAVNVLGTARLMRNAVRHFRGRRGGVLVTISSWVAERGAMNASLIGYAASKAAMRAATQTIARGYAKDGVLAYVIAPGVVRTRLSEQNAIALGGEDKLTAGLAMGEWVPPENIADTVVFLATGKVRHLTGATLDINGATYVR